MTMSLVVSEAQVLEYNCSNKVLAPLNIFHLDKHQVCYNETDYGIFDDYELLVEYFGNGPWAVVPKSIVSNGINCEPTTMSEFSFNDCYIHKFLVMVICNEDTLFSVPVKYDYKYNEFCSDNNGVRSSLTCCKNELGGRWTNVPEPLFIVPSEYNESHLNESDSSHISIYPQPASEYFFIRGNWVKSISIFNLQGQIVYNISGISVKTPKFYTSNLNDGVYLAKVELENGYEQVRKLIVQK